MSRPNLSAVERRYKVKLPPHVKALYEKRDGEKSGSHPWRLQSTKELLELDLDEAYLDHSDDGMLLKKLGPLVPLFTNDESDLLVLHVGGPLDGRLSLVLHDDSSIAPAFRSIESVLKKRRTETYDYVARDPKPAKGEAKADDERAAAALEKAFAREKKGSHAAEYVADVARLLRGQPKPEDTSRFPALWPVKEFVQKMMFSKDSVFATVMNTNAIAAFSTKSGEGTSIATPLGRGETAWTALNHDRSALLVVAKKALWSAPTNGKAKAKKVGALDEDSHRVACELADGRLIVITGPENLQVWAAGKRQAEITSELDFIDNVIASPDGARLFLVPCGGPKIMRIDLDAKKSVPCVTSDGEIYCAAYAEKANLLVYGEGSGRIVIADAKTGKTKASAQGHDGRVSDIVFTPDGIVVSVSEFDNTIRTFDAKGTALSRIDIERPARAAVGPDGRVYVAFAYRGIGRYDVDAKGALSPIP